MSQPDTKHRLLDAAERLFAERGYEAVSIRDIAAAAEVNLAGVNYHFQGKENLYCEVLRRRIVPKRERLLAAIAEVEAAGPEEPRLEMLIRAFVGAHLEDALSSPDGALSLGLMSREMSEPRHGAQVIVEELIGPVRTRYLALLNELLPGLTPARLQMLMGSLVGQFIYFAMYWHNSTVEGIGNRGHGPGTASLGDTLEEYISNVIDHVTRFTLGGIRAQCEGGDL